MERLLYYAQSFNKDFWEKRIQMKIYAVILSDYDLFGEYGYYLHKKDAKKRLAELFNSPKVLENWIV